METIGYFHIFYINKIFYLIVFGEFDFYFYYIIK